MKDDSIPGMAVAITQNGHITYCRYLGYANLEYLSRVTSKSVFQIASVTKQFTALSIMMLVESNKVKLNDRINTYLPDAPASWHDITIKNLLNHTSGLINYEDIPGFTAKAYLDSAHAVVIPSTLNALYQQKLKFTPGSQSEYCNSNYFILGVVLEKVSGETYEQFLKEHILNKAAMDDTHINEMYHVIRHRVAGYTTQEKSLINADRLGMNWFFAEGNIITTLPDLIKWMNALQTHSLLPENVANLMTTPTALNDHTMGKFGYGWFIDKDNKHVVYHSGHTPGFSAFVFNNREKKLSVVLLMNNDNIKTDHLLKIAKDLSGLH